MSDIAIVTGGIAVTIRDAGRVEVLVGETLQFPQPPSYVDGATDDDITIEGTSLVCDSPGLRRFRLPGGAEVNVLACELACMDRIPAGAGQGGAVRDRRAILRAIVQHADFPFAGLASDFDASRGLARFGG